MNEQHKINRLTNRSKRIKRRIAGLHADKVGEVVCALRENRDPDLSATLAQINRLETRAAQLR